MRRTNAPTQVKKQTILLRLQNMQVFAFTDDDISHAGNCGQQYITA